MEEVEDVNKKKQPSFSNQDDRIVLNVGGQRFETTRTTLMAFRGSMLAERFSTRNSSINKPDKNGEYFFDRSSHSFKAILECYRHLRVPTADTRPSTVHPDNWDQDLLFWGLASAEPETPVMNTPLQIIENQRRANRVRFCELVYEEMKGIIERRPKGDHLKITMWESVDNDDKLPTKPIPPKRMKVSDLALYENADYWYTGLLWFQIERIDGQVILDSFNEHSKKHDSERHFRDIWKSLGVKFDIKSCCHAVQLQDERDYKYEIEDYGYPLDLWFDRKPPRFTKENIQNGWIPIRINVSFIAPETERSVQKVETASSIL